jgi:Ca2+-binding EF-hand superfamily protein
MFNKSGFILGLLILVSGCGNQGALNMPELPQEPQNIVSDNNEQVEANGIFDRSLRKIILDAMTKYDHDKSGGIDYRSTDTAWKTLIGKNENIKKVRSVSSTGMSTTVYSMSKLFVASDTNRDGISALEEIETFLSKTYDLNQDGKLQSRGLMFWKDKDEYQLFKSEVGEEVKSFSSISNPVNNQPNNSPNNLPGNNVPNSSHNNSQGSRSNTPEIYYYEN